MRAEITSFIEARVGIRLKSGTSNTRDPNAMDIGAMVGHSPKFDGHCTNCGKYGHKRADCWSAKGGQANSSKGANSWKGGKGTWKGDSGARAPVPPGKGKGPKGLKGGYGKR